MDIEDFNYTLPENLIAQIPLKKRGASKLLSINPSTNSIKDLFFRDFFNLINEKDLLIFNNTKVIKARLHGEKITGGKVEILIERIINDKNALALIKTSKKIAVGLLIKSTRGKIIKVIGRDGGLFSIEIVGESFYALLEEEGHVPVPPYIKRQDKKIDEERYHTIFARESGAVAAPTAGLHFSKSDFDILRQKKISFAFITLHVGSGTFQPVKSNDINNHKMHKEIYHLSQDAIDQIKSTKANGGRIIAIGTTVLRALESAYQHKDISTDAHETDIFIKPGYKFKIVDALFTNFHLPKSTLLMLVSAIAGIDFIKKSYSYAIQNKYRFFSYGDAMFIEQKAKIIDL